jgi:hypothetical protein
MPEHDADQRQLAEAVREILADVRKQPSTGSSMRPVGDSRDSPEVPSQREPHEARHTW